MPVRPKCFVCCKDCRLGSVCEKGQDRGELLHNDEGTEDHDGGKSDEVIEAEPEDVESKRVLPPPDLPTQTEIEEHRVDRTPPRSWCPDCVEGFGREEPHKVQATERSVPVIAFDCLFMTQCLELGSYASIFN